MVNRFHLHGGLSWMADDGLEQGSVGGTRRPHVRDFQAFRKAPPEGPVELGRLVPEDSDCLWIKAGLERADLSFLSEGKGMRGGAPYHPVAMLGILLLAYVEGRKGSGSIEQACRRDVCYMYVSGRLTPDARTLRRFRLEIAPHMQEAFRRVVAACAEEGLLPMRLVAVDGTKIASSASQLGPWLKRSEREDLEQIGLDPPACSDPDARSLGTSGRFVRGYNAQAAVDCDTGVVIAQDLDNVSSDGHWLAPMAEATLKNAGKAPQGFVADAGYDTYEGAHACAGMGSEAVLAPHDATWQFWSVGEGGAVQCPLGHPALPWASTVSEQGKPYVVLRVAACPTCPFYKSCCGPSGGNRTLSHPQGCDPAHRLRATRLSRSAHGKEAMRARMAMVETLFGNVKWNMGLRRFVMKGRVGAETEWTLALLAWNLRILGRKLRKWLLHALRLLLHHPGKRCAWNPVP